MPNMKQASLSVNPVFVAKRKAKAMTKRVWVAHIATTDGNLAFGPFNSYEEANEWTANNVLNNEGHLQPDMLIKPFKRRKEP